MIKTFLGHYNDEHSLKIFNLFHFGGSIVAVATYFGSEKKGLISAFFALFPFITTFILFTVYSEAGLDATTSYAKGLLIINPYLNIISCLYSLFTPKIWFLGCNNLWNNYLHNINHYYCFNVLILKKRICEIPQKLKHANLRFAATRQSLVRHSKNCKFFDVCKTFGFATVKNEVFYMLSKFENFRA